MHEIERRNSNPPGALTSEKIPSTVSPAKSENAERDPVTLGPLSSDLAKHLLQLSKDVTKDKVTPETVDAACNCASKLLQLMAFNFEMKRLGLK